jgi:hypothetical protein
MNWLRFGHWQYVIEDIPDEIVARAGDPESLPYKVQQVQLVNPEIS